MRPRAIFPLAAMLLALLLAACGGAPAPIRYGEEACTFCRMAVSDERFGAQLVTAKGRTHAFDSIECLASFHLVQVEGGAPRMIRVSDYARPGSMLDAMEAIFVRDEALKSPMGRGAGIAAFGTREAADRVGGEMAELLTWAQVLDIVREEGMNPHHAHVHSVEDVK